MGFYYKLLVDGVMKQGGMSVSKKKHPILLIQKRNKNNIQFCTVASQDIYSIQI